MTVKINLDDLQKVESSTVRSLVQSAQHMVQAIIKVKKANYVPKNVRVRVKIDSHLLTGDFRQSDLETLEQDPQVESVSINKKLQSAE